MFTSTYVMYCVYLITNEELNITKTENQKKMSIIVLTMFLVEMLSDGSYVL